MIQNVLRSSPSKLADGIYFIGENTEINKLNDNPYLIIEHEEAVLIDPGSVLDFKSVFKNITSLISLDAIKLIVVHHQDPDLCSSIPLLNKAGLKVPIALHWRTSIVVKHYGIENEFYCVNENKWTWEFSSGRKIRFIFAPYCHFAGSIMTYDEKTKTLFSGDLFGSLKPPKYMYADEKYITGMIAFHEHYMPSKDILQPVMDLLLNMNIERIAPQHGCIIKDNIEKYILEVRNIKCGIYKQSLIDKQSDRNEIKIISFLSDIINKMTDFFTIETVYNIFKTSLFVLDQKTNNIIRINMPIENNEIINMFIKTIIDNKGIRYLSIIEPFFRTKIEEYGFPLPTYFYQSSKKATPVITKIQENRDIKEKNDTDNFILYDSVTNLYNKSVFLRFVDIFIESIKIKNFAFVYFTIEGLDTYVSEYGREEIEKFLQSFSYILKNIGRAFPSLRIFKLDEYFFSCIIENSSRIETLKIINKIQQKAVSSSFFPKSFHFPAAVLYSENLINNLENITTTDVDLILQNMLSVAIKKGINGINDIFMQPEKILNKKEIFILEPDTTYIAFLKPNLEALGYKVFVFSKGVDIRSEIEKHLPSLFIAEAMSPQFNGFELRSQLLQNPESQNIPFILVSHRKDESFVQRAVGLKIMFFLKKPFFREELFGLVNNILL